jgi:fatty acid desaturase
MGEIAYAKMRGDLAKRIIASNPLRFINLSLRRLYYFWFSVPHAQEPGFIRGFVSAYGRNLNFQFTSIAGLFGLILALRRRIPAAWLFFWAFLLIPWTYYFVTVHARFRHPLEPLITILGVYLFQSAEKSWQVRWFRRSALPASARS